MLNKTTRSDDNRKAVPSTDAELALTELEQVSGGYWVTNRNGYRHWVEDDYAYRRNFFHRPQRLVVTIAACASLALLARPAVCSPLTTGFTGPASHFTIGKTPYEMPHDHVDFLFYNLGVQRWLVQLNPDPPEYLASPTDNFTEVLSNKFPATAGGLQYQSTATPLSDDSLIVHWYDAVHSGSKVGADFGVEYVPHGTDPVANLHWIQVITDSDPENKVDARYVLTDPYYDDGGVANSSFFRDRPRRGDSSPHSWSAETFLVGGPPVVPAGKNGFELSPGTITFFGGIHWGWENFCTNCCGGGGTRSDFGFGTDAAPCSGTPEPATWFLAITGILLITVSACCKRLKAHRRHACQGRSK